VTMITIMTTKVYTRIMGLSMCMKLK